jgi:hypothetical protein
MAQSAPSPCPFPRVRDPDLESLPVKEDLTTNSVGKTLMAMMAAADRVGRPYVAPPNTSAEAMNILRGAFARLEKDPEVREDAKKMMMTVGYTSGDEALKTMNYLLTQPEPVIKEFGKYIKFQQNP